jgi:hypothetical protein
MLPAANVPARQRGRRSGGAPRRLAAAVLLLALLALCCRGRADAVASSLGTHWLPLSLPLALPSPE